MKQRVILIVSMYLSGIYGAYFSEHEQLKNLIMSKLPFLTISDIIAQDKDANQNRYLLAKALDPAAPWQRMIILLKFKANGTFERNFGRYQPPAFPAQNRGSGYVIVDKAKSNIDYAIRALQGMIMVNVRDKTLLFDESGQYLGIREWDKPALGQ